MLRYIADRLILKPTRNQLPCEQMLRFEIELSRDASIEILRQSYPNPRSIRSSHWVPEQFVLKFPGTGGRAERSTVHPAEHWPACQTEVWAVNPPGYGNARGRARMANIVPVADACMQAIIDRNSGQPLLVTGNSLGTISALYVGAHYPVDALLLRNPIPLRDLILEKHSLGWKRTFGNWISELVPLELDAKDNAQLTICPALIVSSELDSVAPLELQRRILERYRGPTFDFVIEDADHGDPISERQKGSYRDAILWLYNQMQTFHCERISDKKVFKSSKISSANTSIAESHNSKRESRLL